MSTPTEPWADRRITAYLMDELTPTDTAQFEADMQEHPELANAFDEARRVTEKLASYYAAMPTSTLDASRRERIEGAAVTPRSDSGADRGYSRWRITLLAIAASFLILAAALPRWQTPKIRTASNFAVEKKSSPILENSESPVQALSQQTAPAPMLKSAPPPAIEPSQPPASSRRAITESNAERYAERYTEPFAANVADANPDAKSRANGMSSDVEMEAASDSVVMRSRGMPAADISAQSSTSKNARLGRAARVGDQVAVPISPGDTRLLLGESGFQRVTEQAWITLSVDVDTGSYAKVRTYLQNHQLPPRDAVQIEEMVSFFAYDDAIAKASDGGPSDPFTARMSATICPWNPEHRLVRLALQSSPLTEQSTGTPVKLAEDVKVEIEFNPGAVSSYRLIGNENRVHANEDFNDGTNEGTNEGTNVDNTGGAGRQFTALYEVVPIAVEVDAITSSVEMLTLRLRDKHAQGTTSELMTRELDDSRTPFDQADGDFRFAASVAAFGMLLRESPLAGSWTYDDVLRVAEGAVGDDPHGLRAEFVGLVTTAKTLTMPE